jgi:hypothetical protein
LKNKKRKETESKKKRILREEGEDVCAYIYVY